MSTSSDDRESLDHASTLLYHELRRLARRELKGERVGHTLQTTALVHEAYLRLAGSAVEFRDRGSFLALSARLMRRILVDHARGRGREKRGAGAVHVPIEEAGDLGHGGGLEILLVDRALEELASQDTRKARLVELQIFAGLTYGELAQAERISLATVHRELRLGRAYLERALAVGP